MCRGSFSGTPPGREPGSSASLGGSGTCPTAVFEGTREKVTEMVRWCEEGPPHAGVEDVEAEFEAPGEDLDGFEVR
jgi:hypothetical protein